MFQLQRDHTFQEDLCLKILETSLDQLYTLPRELEVSSKFAQPVNMLIWKRHLTVSLVVSCGRCSTGTVSWPNREGCSVSVLLEQKLGLHCRSDLFLVHVENQSSKYEAIVPDRKRVAYPLRFGGEVVPHTEEFKYLGVIFTSEGKKGCETTRQNSAPSVITRSVYRTVVVKKELNWKAKLHIQSAYIPALTYGDEYWGVAERMRVRIQVAETAFFHWVAQHYLRDRMRSSVTLEELGVEPKLLLIESGQLRTSMWPPGRLSERCSRQDPPQGEGGLGISA